MPLSICITVLCMYFKQEPVIFLCHQEPYWCLHCSLEVWTLRSVTQVFATWIIRVTAYRVILVQQCRLVTSMHLFQQDLQLASQRTKLKKYFNSPRLYAFSEPTSGTSSSESSLVLYESCPKFCCTDFPCVSCSVVTYAQTFSDSMCEVLYLTL